LWYHNNKDDENTRNKQYKYNNKLLVMNHYGHKCNWPGCNVTDINFLTGDHINNNGAEHRRKIGTGSDVIHRWLIKNNFPPGFQVLCWNHQHFKRLEFNKSKWKQNKWAIWERKSLYNLRLLIIKHYGSRCTCCEETNIDLLTIDHINGGGTKHIKKLGGTHNFYRWLRDNNFPPGFQVLCHNCNDGRHINGGICPHKG
jgi:hypothetical protein